MIYLQLFVSFMKIGFTSFGGMSMVPLILEEMSSHGWMTAEDLANLVAIA
jgi:chromate transporter